MVEEEETNWIIVSFWGINHRYLKVLIALLCCVYLPSVFYASDLKKPNFSGVWILDKGASASTDKLLKTLGKSKLEIKMADTLIVKQDIIQTEHEITVEVNNQISKQIQKFRIDGKTEMINTENMGPIKTRTYWSDDGVKLINDMYLTNEQGLDMLCRSTRSLVDQGRTMIIEIEIFPTNDSSIRTKRVFRKKIS